MSDIELLNCPFCGSEHVSHQFAENMKPQPHFVACLSCGATGRYTQEKWYALQSWNTRAPSPEASTLTAKLKAAEEVLEGIHAISLCTETFASIDTVKEVKDMSRQALEAIRGGKHE